MAKRLADAQLALRRAEMRLRSDEEEWRRDIFVPALELQRALDGLDLVALDHVAFCMSW